eukprot:1141032-Pelagomonas_calceolata.AAC.1
MALQPRTLSLSIWTLSIWNSQSGLVYTTMCAKMCNVVHILFNIRNRAPALPEYTADNRHQCLCLCAYASQCPYNKGNSGKSCAAHVCALYGRGILLPAVNDAKEFVATAADICIAMKIRNPSPIIMDMPQAMKKFKLFGIYSAIAQVKNGWLYDLHYNFKQWYIDSPALWALSNTLPVEAVQLGGVEHSLDQIQEREPHQGVSSMQGREPHQCRKGSHIKVGIAYGITSMQERELHQCRIESDFDAGKGATCLKPTAQSAMG